MKIQKYVAELVGTFGLTLTAALCIAKGFGAFTPFMVAIILGLFVYSIGHISGAHANPGITIGAFSIRKISLADTVLYVIAQFAGAALAVLLLIAFKIAIPTAPANLLSGMLVACAEAVGMFFFAFGVAAVLYGRVASTMNGIVIGGSLLIGLILSSTLGAIGIVNPAIAFGLHALTWAYIVGPIVGSIAGMWAYHGLSEKKF